MAASDLGLGVAGVKVYAAGPDGAKFVVTLFHAVRHDVLAIIGSARPAAHRSRERRRGEVSGEGWCGQPRRHRHCGRQAETQIAAVRAALPEISSTVVFCRDPQRRASFAHRVAAEPARHQQAAAQDVVVTITTSKDPVLRGEWLRPGALVCAASARRADQPRAGQHGARASRVRLRLAGGRAARIR